MSNTTKAWGNSQAKSKKKVTAEDVAREIANEDYEAIRGTLELGNSSLSKAYGGWNSQEDMDIYKTNVSNAYGALSKFASTHSVNNSDITNALTAYKGVMDNWGGLSNLYGQYQNADAFKAAMLKQKENEKPKLQRYAEQFINNEDYFDVIDKVKSDYANATKGEKKYYSLDKLDAQEDERTKDVGYYILGAYGKDSDEYKDYITELQYAKDKKNYEKAEKGYTDLVRDNGFVKALAVSSVLPQILAEPLVAGQKLFNTATGTEFNPYVGPAWAANLIQAGQNEVSREIAENTSLNIRNTNVASFLYNTANSMVHSRLGEYQFGALFTPMMGAGAYNQTYKEGLERGLDKSHAEATALAAGVAEALFEYWSLDKLVKLKSPGKFKDIFVNSLKQFGVEGSEEFFTELSNIATDTLINKGDSQITQSYQEYLDRGFEKDAAMKNAALDSAEQIIGAFVGGGLSGFGSAFLKSSVNYGQNVSAGKNMNQATFDEGMNQFHELSSNDKALKEYAELSAKFGTEMKNKDYAQMAALANNAIAEASKKIDSKKSTSDEKEAYYEAGTTLRSSFDSKATKGQQIEVTLKKGDVTTDRSGKAVQIASVTDKNGAIMVTTSTGEEMRASDMTLTRSDAKLIGAAIDMDDQTARDLLLTNYSGQNVSEYLKEFYNAWAYGKNGESFNSLVKKSSVIEELNLSKIYTAAAERQMAINKEITDASNVLAEANRTYAPGKVDLSEINKKDLSFSQRNYIEFFKVLAKVTGINFKLTNDVSDTSYNGDYDKTDKSIMINLAARRGKSMSTYNVGYVMSTTAHEMTHWMEDQMGEEFSILRDAIAQGIGEEKFNQLVADEMKKNDLSESVAVSEVIARACEDMLNDTETAKKILIGTSQGNLEKIKAAIERFFEKLQKFFDDMLKNYSSNVEAANELKRCEATFNQVKDIWVDMMQKAIAIQDVVVDYTAEENTNKKFSTKSTVESTENLIAMHNLTAEQLLKTIKLGGFALPSIAIMKQYMPHTEYGDVTVVFPKDTINPSENKKNKVYSADAWTPSFPTISKKVSEKAQKRIEKTILDILGGRDAYYALGTANLDYDNMMDKFNRNENPYDAYGNNDIMKYAFLKDVGKGFEVPTKEKTYSNMLSNDALGAIAKVYSEALEEYRTGGYQWYKDNAEEVDRIRLQLNEAYIRENQSKLERAGLSEAVVKHYQNMFGTAEDGMDFSTFDRIARAMISMNKGRETVVDTVSFQDKLRDINNEEYKAWLNKLFDGVIEKEGIRNNADYYTSSGNRRSWEALHWEVTLENIAKAMLLEESTGSDGFFAGNNFFGAAVKSYKNIDEMRKDMARLVTQNEEERQKLRDQYSEELSALGQSIQDGEGFGKLDSALEALVDAIRKRSTVSGIDSYLKKEYSFLNLKSDTAQRTYDLFQKISSMPTEYYEAKPMRTVSLEEISYVVLPDNASSELLKALDDNEIVYYKFQAGNDADRVKVVNEHASKEAGTLFSKKVDSDNNKLTDVQAEYFKDSKVRDDNGNLLVVYHGTPNKGFTEFRGPLNYYTANKDYAVRYENTSATDTRKEAGTPGMYKGYLNIVKPFDITDKKAKQIYVEEYIKGGYAQGINPYISDAEINKIIKDGIDWVEAENLKDFFDENEYDYDGIVLNEGGDITENGTVMRGDSYVTFNSNQFKNIDNLNPSDNPDIRYSQKIVSQPTEPYTETDENGNFSSKLLWEHVKKQCIPIKVGKSEQYYIEMDGNKKVQLSSDSINHGYRNSDGRPYSRIQANAIRNINISSNIVNVLKNSQKAVQLEAHSPIADYSEVYFGLAESNGEMYIVRSVVEHITNNSYILTKYDIFDRAYAVNAKKMSDTDTKLMKATEASSDASFEVTLSDLMAYVKSTFDDNADKDILNTLVLDAYGFIETIPGKLGLTDERIDKLLSNEYYGANNPQYAQAYITYMSPDEFLSLTTGKNKRGLNQVTEWGVNGDGYVTEDFDIDIMAKKYNNVPMQLKISTDDSEVVGHNGRHRMWQLKQMGYNQIPILLFDRSNEYDKKRIDSIDLMPQHLQKMDDSLNESDRVTIKDLIPFSQGNTELIKKKFGSGSNAQLFSKKIETPIDAILEDNKVLKKQNELLQSDVDRLKERLKLQAKVTNGKVLKKSQIEAAARVLLRENGSKYDAKELAKDLQSVYGYMVNNPAEDITSDAIMNKCYDVATRIMREAAPEKVENDYYAEILRDIRTSKIKLNAEQIQEAKNQYGNEWRQALFGRVNLSKNGTMLDQKWQEWAEMYPSVFDVETNPNDQITELLYIYDDVKDASVLLRERNTRNEILDTAYEVYNKFWNIEPEVTIADKYAGKIKKLSSEHRKAMNEIKKASQDKLNKQKLADDMYYGKRMMKAIEAKNQEISGIKSKAASDLAKAKNNYDAKLEKQRLADAMYYNRIINEVKKNRDAKFENYKEYQKKKQLNYKDAAARSEMVSKINKTSKDLFNWLQMNKKNKYVPEPLRGPLTALLTSIDYSSKQLLGLKGGDKAFTETNRDKSFARAIEKVRDMVLDATSIEVKDGEIVELRQYDFPPGFEDEWREIAKKVLEIERSIGADNVHILNMMSLNDLTTLYNAISTMKHLITSVNKVLSSENAHSMDVYAADTAKNCEEVGSKKRADSRLARFLEYDNALPYYVFDQLGDGAKYMFGQVIEGQDKYAKNLAVVYDFVTENKLNEHIDEWEEHTQTFEVMDREVEGKSRTVTLTDAQIMSLYCLSKRDQAMKHINGKGIRVTDIGKGKNHIVQTKNVPLSDTELAMILGTLSDEQREVADKLQEFMNTTCKEWGNYVTMKRFLIKGFQEKNYFPIKVDSNALTPNPRDDVKSIYQLLNMSFTKPLAKYATNPIEVGSIFDVFTNHSTEMAKYNALALPVLDMIRWWGYKEKVDDSNEVTVRGQLEQAYGKGINTYISHMLQDLNGSQEKGRGDDIQKRMLKAYKVAAVGANLQVAALQPIAIIRAGIVINPKYLAAGVRNHKQGEKEMLKHSGIAIWKVKLGFYDVNVSKGLSSLIRNSKDLKDTIADKALKAAGDMDTVTWVTIWNACKLEVAEKQKLTGDALMEATAKRFDEVIYQTQVVDSMLTRSDVMRSQSVGVQSATAFMSEPTVSYNTFLGVYNKMGNEYRKSKNFKDAFKKYGGNLRRAAAAYIFSSMAEAVIRGLFTKWRESDDDNLLELMWEEFLSNMNPLNNIPYFKDVMGIFRGYNPKRLEYEGISNAVKAIDGIKKIPEKGLTYKTVYRLAQTFSQVTGIPLSSAMRDLIPLWNNTIGAMFDLKLK